MELAAFAGDAVVAGDDDQVNAVVRDGDAGPRGDGGGAVTFGVCGASLRGCYDVIASGVGPIRDRREVPATVRPGSSATDGVPLAD